MVGSLIALLLVQPQGTLGKTDAQIISMGREKWVAYHASKVGESTASVSDAHSVYGQVLFRRNAALEKKLPKSRRDLISMMRIDLVAYCNSLIEVSAAFSGGGTAWVPVYAAVSSYVEETLYGVLANKPASSKTSAASVSAALSAIRAEIKKSSSSLNDFKGSGYGAAFAMERLGGASNVFSRVSINAKKLGIAHSYSIHEFCLKRAKSTLAQARYTDVP